MSSYQIIIKKSNKFYEKIKKRLKGRKTFARINIASTIRNNKTLKFPKNKKPLNVVKIGTPTPRKILAGVGDVGGAMAHMGETKPPPFFALTL